MLIGLKKRFIFVANTKTASTSIEALLEPHVEYHHDGSPERKHLPLSQSERSIPEIFQNPAYPFDSFFRFGVMRDPVEWIESWFRYRKIREIRDPLPADMNFHEFWNFRDWNIVREDGTKYLQSDMFMDREGNLLADAILPYHNLEKEFARVCGFLGISAGLLPHKNVSPPAQKVGGIPPELLDEVRSFYEEDYDLFSRLEKINAVGLKKLGGRKIF